MVVNKIDYTPYYLSVNESLKNTYDMLKKNQFIEAATTIDEMIVELRMMKAAVKSHVEHT